MEAVFLHEVKPEIRTIYFGGGTPSLLEEHDFEQIFAAISEFYDISSCKEITMEANPDDLSPDYVKMIKRFPFNRISIGVQSFQDNELIAINRRHTASQAAEAVMTCYNTGFENISIDLMYGLPDQTIDSFGKTIGKALSLPVKHISSYALSWEVGSVLYKKLKQGILKQASDEFLETCYFELNNLLMSKDFVRYELSNFSLQGYESKHNYSYWDGTYYLGLGVLMYELERLFGISKRYYCMYNARKSLKNGLLVYENNSLKIDEKGLFIADSICSDLIWA